MARRACISRIAACSWATASTRSATSRGGQLLDEEEHLDRLERSLRELGMAMPMGRAALKLVMREMVAPQPHARRLSLSAGDARRGAARSCPVPPIAPRPTLIITMRAAWTWPALRRAAGEGHRGHHPARQALGRCDIKTVQLLPNLLAKTGGASRPAPSRPGWWTTTALSPKAPRPTPGSSTRTAAHHPRSQQRHPARRHPPHHAGGGGRGAAARWWSANSPSRRRKAAQGSLHLLGHRGRGPGGRDRRPTDRRTDARAR